MKWEHRAIVFQRSAKAEEIDAELNAAGAEGWEAVGLLDRHGTRIVDGNFVVLMKRQL